MLSKRTTTGWYIGTWFVWLVAFVRVVVALHGSGATLNSLPATAKAGYVAMGLAALVMFVMWIAALIKLVQLRSWDWVSIVAILQLIGLGVIGMAAYAVAGPADTARVVYRPKSRRQLDS